MDPQPTQNDVQVVLVLALFVVGLALLLIVTLDLDVLFFAAPASVKAFIGGPKKEAAAPAGQATKKYVILGQADC